MWDQSEAVADFSCFSVVSPEKQIHKISTWAPCKFQRRSHQALNEVSECLNSCLCLISGRDIREVSLWNRSTLIPVPLIHVSQVDQSGAQNLNLGSLQVSKEISSSSQWSFRMSQLVSVFDLRQRHQRGLIMKSIYSHSSPLNSCISGWSFMYLRLINQVHKISSWAPCTFQRRSHQALNEVSECLNSCVSFWSQAEDIREVSLWNRSTLIPVSSIHVSQVDLRADKELSANAYWSFIQT